jgi:hypothetical protein
MVAIYLFDSSHHQWCKQEIVGASAVKAYYYIMFVTNSNGIMLWVWFRMLGQQEAL